MIRKSHVSYKAIENKRSSVNTTHHTVCVGYVKITMLDVRVLKVFSSICLVQLHIHLPDKVHLKMKSQLLSIHPMQIESRWFIVN